MSRSTTRTTSLVFTPARTQDDARSIWKISGAANFGSLAEENPPERVATPTAKHAIGTGTSAKSFVLEMVALAADVEAPGPFPRTTPTAGIGPTLLFVPASATPGSSE